MRTGRIARSFLLAAAAVLPLPAVRAAGAEEPVPPPVPSRTAEGILLEGTATFPDGSVPRSFQFTLRDSRKPILVVGKDGKFEARLPRADEYRFSGFLADRFIHDYLPETVVIEEGKPLRLSLLDAREATLVVRDAATGEPLPGARALRIPTPFDHWEWSPYPVPGWSRVETLTADEEGRIDLGSRRGTEKTYVVADGHAWVRVEAPHNPGGDIPVDLPAGGRLRVRIPRWAEAGKAMLCFQPEGEGERWKLPAPDAAGECLLEGLPAGMGVISVRRDRQWSDGVVLGMETLEIRAGETAEADLDVESPAPRATQAVRGTIRRHPAWGPGKFQVRIWGRDEENEEEGDTIDLKPESRGRPVTFTSDPLPVGRYWLEVEPQWDLAVEVTAEAEEMVIHVPEPALVLIQVVARETGKPLPDSRVTWCADVPDKMRSYLENALPTATPGLFEARVPPGHLRFTVEAPGRIEFHDRYSGRFPLQAGREGETAPLAPGERRERTIALDPGGTLRATLRFGGSVVVTDSMKGTLRRERVSEGISSRSVRFENGVAFMDGLEPGTHHLDLEVPSAMYEPVHSRPVEIRPGEIAEVVIDLVRRK